ncbi:ECF transporter S component [Mycoplasmopsis columbinasalis]|uniref:Predicted membrane protein n=1 Tax=Mycoplasmopsis columbinasalis TaxID=114880 RepID=A0A449BAX7_9BACT|nr:ECF transporter S component [Mycoplasmopsis columbinasalis]VEU78328.1 Predicted membrane protein [Mycoplasmopsis columbinasalis]
MAQELGIKTQDNAEIRKRKKHKRASKLGLNSFTIQRLVFIATYFALFLISGFTIYFGYIPLATTTLTYLPVILVVATVHLGVVGALCSGLFFGISSFIAAMLVGAIAYQMPDISILSRVLLGVAVAGIYKALKADRKMALWKFMVMSVSATILNIAFVLTIRYIHNSIAEIKGTLPIIEWIITHPVTLIAEPLMAILFSILLYHLVMYLRKKYLHKKELIYGAQEAKSEVVTMSNQNEELLTTQSETGVPAPTKSKKELKQIAKQAAKDAKAERKAKKAKQKQQEAPVEANVGDELNASVSNEVNADENDQVVTKKPPKLTKKLLKPNVKPKNKHVKLLTKHKTPLQLLLKNHKKLNQVYVNCGKQNVKKNGFKNVLNVNLTSSLWAMMRLYFEKNRRLNKFVT